jgi:hypothetical protein
LILGELSFSLFELDLVRPRIDLHELRALMNDVALVVIDLHQFPIDSRFDRNRGERRHRSESCEVDIDRSSCGDSGGHRNRRRLSLIGG